MRYAVPTGKKLAVPSGSRLAIPMTEGGYVGPLDGVTVLVGYRVVEICFSYVFLLKQSCKNVFTMLQLSIM